MCLAIPYKVISVKDKKIIVDGMDQKKEVAGSLLKIKVGDYVILQNNFIIRKISKKSAKEVLNLIKK